MDMSATLRNVRKPCSIGNNGIILDRGDHLTPSSILLSKELYKVMAKLKKHKERNLSWYKAAAWVSFSRFIRTRDCLATTGDVDFGICCTCKKRKHFKDLQAGHFIPGRGSAILFEETCVSAQCAACNKWKNGNVIEYTPFMQEKYGQKEIDRLYALARTTRKYTINELLALREYYDQKTEELQKVYREGVPALSYEEICKR